MGFGLMIGHRVEERGLFRVKSVLMKLLKYRDAFRVINFDPADYCPAPSPEPRLTQKELPMLSNTICWLWISFNPTLTYR
jgi:hypothetical protein